MIHASDFRARYEESDQMGFIHHSNYIVWMELARIDLLREHGIDYRGLEKQGLLLPVVEIYSKYVSPAYFDDNIKVIAAFTKISLVKIRVDYLIYRNDNILVSYGYTLHCFITKENKKPIKIPSIVYDKIFIDEKALEWISWSDK
ncbi:MAG: acyl-CoA thioesterase [Brevinematales bacterium]|nr:acyl-CoA thioesterase [Brevinematales bacterium]